MLFEFSTIVQYEIFARYSILTVFLWMRLEFFAALPNVMQISPSFHRMQDIDRILHPNELREQDTSWYSAECKS